MLVKFFYKLTKNPNLKKSFLFIFFFWGGGGGGVAGRGKHNVQILKMALLLFKENKCAKLFSNTCLNTEEMAQTSSIYDHFII